MKASLILSDGSLYEGRSMGAQGTTTGEVVFNTAMTGYQEILTDPSYHFQLIAMTYPQIGNYGVNPKDFESKRIYAAGFIIREYSPIVSHWQADRSLDAYLKQHGIVGISDIDTRALTRRLRDHGAQMGMITTSDESFDTLLERLRAGDKLVGRDIVKEVTTDRDYDWPLSHETDDSGKDSPRVAVYDYGVKFSILRTLQDYGCRIRVFPGHTPPEALLEWDQRRFDLSRDLPFRCNLIRLSEAEHILVTQIHHLITDVWSRVVFHRDLERLYSACVSGLEPQLPDLPIQYADYTIWQRQLLNGDRLEKRVARWRDRLQGFSASVDLPTEGPAPQPKHSAARPSR